MNDKEEFSRGEPGRIKLHMGFLLGFIALPICLIIIGLFISTQKFSALMNYDPVVVGNPLLVFHSGYRVYNPLIFILGMVKYAFNNAYSYYFFQAVPVAAVCISISIILFFSGNILIKSSQKNQHIHGTARWATLKDIKRFGMLQRYGVVCGQLNSAHVTYAINPEKASMTLHQKKKFLSFMFSEKSKYANAPLICQSPRTNFWIIAPTRAGKGVSFIIPTLLLLGELYQRKKDGKKEVAGANSVVVFDPKGENWEATSGWRSKFSVCMPFRPLDPNGDTVHYNPIHEIPDNPSEAFSWADMIAEIFFGADNAKTASDGASAYFNNTARDIFSGVVLHVRFSQRFPWEKKNLSTVLDVFSQANSESNSDKGEDSCGEAMLAQMREESFINDNGEVVPNHVDDSGKEAPLIHDLIVKAANRSETQVAKERASTYSTVFSKISLFQDPLLASATAYSDFSVDDFVEGKNAISLYLIVPYNHIKRISPVFRMVITFMIKKFSSGTTNANSVKLKIPCLFLLDEFPVLGYFPDIALNAGILAGYGVTFCIVSQSLNQIVDVYGENHPFLDHCKTIILCAPGNIKDAKTFSDAIGTRSVLLDNISASGQKGHITSQSVSRSSQETETSLINADELMKLEFNRCLVICQNMPPIKAKKVVYYEDPRFKSRSFMDAPDIKHVLKLVRGFPSHKKRNLGKLSKIAQSRISAIESVFAAKVSKNGEDFIDE